MSYYSTLEKEKELLNKKNFSPLNDIPLWVKNLSKGYAFANSPEEMAKAKALNLARGLSAGYEESAKKYGERQTGESMAEYRQRTGISGAPEHALFTVKGKESEAPSLNVGDPLEEIQNALLKGSEAWSKALTYNPRTDLPEGMTYEQFKESPESSLFNIPLPWSKEGFNVSGPGVAELATPDIIIPWGKGAKGINLLDDVVKALQKGITKEAIFESLTKSTQAAGRKLAAEEADDLIKTAVKSMEQTGTKVTEGVEAAIKATEDLPLKEVGVTIPSAGTKVTEGLMTDLPDFGNVLDIALKPDNARKLANLKVGDKKPFQTISKLIGGQAAIAEKPGELANVGRAMLKFEADNKATAYISLMDSFGDERKLFNLGDDFIGQSGSLKGVHINDITQYPNRYALTDTQKAWVKQVHIIEDAKLNFLKRNGVEPNLLHFEDGGHYAGRRMIARELPDGTMQLATIKGDPVRAGSKASFEKMREFTSMAEATKEGFVTMSQRDALYMNIKGAYRRVINKQQAEWMFDNAIKGKFEGLGIREKTISSLPRLRNGINVASYKGYIANDVRDLIKKSYPQFSEDISRASKIKDLAERKQTFGLIKDEIYKLELTEGERAFVASEMANRNLTGTKDLIKSINSKYFPGATIAKIRRTYPEVADLIDSATAIAPNDIDKVISRISLEYWDNLKIPRKQFKDKLFEVRMNNPITKENPLKMSDVNKATDELLKDKKLSSDLLEKIYKNSYEIASAEKKALLDDALVKAKSLYADAKKEAVKARGLKDSLSEEVKKLHFGEAELVGHPYYAGKVFTGKEAQNTAKILKEGLEPEFIKALDNINQVNSVGRFFALAGDASPFMIQLLYLAGSNPRVYGGAIKGFVKALFDPAFLSKYHASHIATYNKYPGLILTKGGATEFTELMGKGGLAQKGVLKTASKPLVPFQRAWEGAMDVAGTEMIESLDNLGTSPAAKKEIEAFVNEFRGIMSTEKIALSSVQQQSESALILANKYNRAIVALLADTFKGGLRGRLAREHLTKGVTAIVAASVSFSLMQGETIEEAVAHLNPADNNFLTWNIAGQRIGPGSKVRSVVKLLADSIVYTTKFPDISDEDFLHKLWDYIGDSPSLRFIRGNLSPIAGTSVDVLSGKNYVGDPTRDGLPSLSKTILAENLLPIWIQSVTFGDGDLGQRLLRGSAEFLGMRTSPMTPAQQRNELRDTLSEQDYKRKWEDLNGNEKKILQNEHPELQELTEKASESWGLKAEGESKIWIEHDNDIKRARDSKDTSIELAAKEFRQTGDGTKFRLKIDDINKAYGGALTNIETNEKYKFVYEFYNKELTPEEEQKIAPKDLARRDYYKIMYAPGIYDEFGNYNYDVAEQRKEQFRNKYGQEMVDYVDEAIGLSRINEPPELKLLRYAKEVLKPYWGVQDYVWAKYPQEVKMMSDAIDKLEKTDPEKAKLALQKYPQILYIRKTILEMKKAIKEKDTRIPGALKMFYSY